MMTELMFLQKSVFKDQDSLFKRKVWNKI